MDVFIRSLFLVGLTRVSVGIVLKLKRGGSLSVTMIHRKGTLAEDVELYQIKLGFAWLQEAQHSFQ